VFFALGGALAALTRSGRHAWLIWLCLAGLMLPSTLALAFPSEVPSAVRSIGAQPMVMVLAAWGMRVALARLHGLWEDAGAAGPPGKGWQALSVAIGAGILTGLAGEAVSVYPLYFDRYVKAQPYQNYSISLEMARAIDDFADDGEAYILVAPHWYDGNAVRAQLRRAIPSQVRELDQLRPGEGPLDGRPGRVLVIFHPDDVRAAELLASSFKQHIVLENRRADGSVAFKAFYGER